MDVEVTGGEGVDVQGHVLFLRVSDIQEVRSDRPIGGVGAEVQDHHAQNGEDDAHGLSAGAVAEGQTCRGHRSQVGTEDAGGGGGVRDT